MVTPPYDFPVIPTYEEAWQKVKGSKLAFFLIVLTFVGLMFVIGMTAAALHLYVGATAAILVSIVGDVFQLILSWGIIYLGIQRAIGVPIFYNMLKNVFSFDLLGKMFGLYFLYFLILGVPLVLPLIGFILVKYVADTAAFHLIQGLLALLGGIISFYIAMRIMVAKAIVVNERRNPLTAIKISFAATKNNIWKVFGFLILQIVALVVSIIPFGIGLIWSIPLCSIAYGLLYRKLVVLRTDLVV